MNENDTIKKNYDFLYPLVGAPDFNIKISEQRQFWDTRYPQEDIHNVRKYGNFLCHEKEYSDFELEFEINIINPEINSGVQFRSACKEPAGKQKYGAVYGPQIELATKKAQSRSGLIYGQGWKSWLTEKDVASHTHMKQQGWNKVRLVAIGKSVKTWINGQFIHETIIPDDRHATNSKGFIALQCHGIKDPGPYKIAWKNIRVKDLTKEK